MPTREHIFRQPQIFESVHASTLAELPDGRIVAAWFGGTRESHPDVAIWGAIRSDNGWTEARLLAKVARQAHWNPVLFAPGDGAIYLFFKVGRSPRVWRTYVMRSRDGCWTWSEPRELVRRDVGGRGPAKNKPIVLADGTWLAPASTEHPREKTWDVYVDRSEDGGQTWTAGEFIALDHATFDGAGVIQPTLWESEPGRVHLLCRSTNGYVCRGDSRDGGRTWTPLRATTFPNNNSGLDVARLADGRLALVANPTAGNWAPRTPLSILLSNDDGRTWTRRLDLEDEPDAEFSYPSIIATANGELATVYTWKRTEIAYWRGRPEDLREVDA